MKPATTSEHETLESAIQSISEEIGAIGGAIWIPTRQTAKHPESQFARFHLYAHWISLDIALTRKMPIPFAISIGNSEKQNTFKDTVYGRSYIDKVGIKTTNREHIAQLINYNNTQSTFVGAHCCPICFREEDGRGLFVFFFNDRENYSQNYFGRIQKFVSEAASVLEHINSRRMNYVINKVVEDLSHFHVEGDLNKSGQSIVNFISSEMQIAETSIFIRKDIGNFLAERARKRGKGTTLFAPKAKFQTRWKQLFDEEAPYVDTFTQSNSDGIAGWALNNRKSLHINSVCQMYHDPELANFELSNVSWTQPTCPNCEDTGYPSSVYVSPVVFSNQPIGLIRCGYRLKQPYSYGREDRDLIKIVGRLLIESAYFEQLVGTGVVFSDDQNFILGVGQHVSTKMEATDDGSKLSRSQMADLFLDGIKTLSNNKLSASVRMPVFDEDDNPVALKFDKVVGPGWKKTKFSEVSKHRFPFTKRNGDWTSRGAFVYNDMQSYYKGEDSESDPIYKPTLKAFTEEAMAPIRLGEKGRVLGVLDIQGTSQNPIGFHDPILATERLAQHLALILRLADAFEENISVQQQSQKTLQDAIEVKGKQTEVLRNMEHQMRTPLISANRRLDDLFKGSTFTSDDYQKVRMIRALIRRADQVTLSNRLYFALEEQGTVPAGDEVSLSPLIVEEHVRLAIEIANVLSDPARGITYKLSQRGFYRGAIGNSKIDLSYLDQMLTNLLENAEVYSYPETTVYLHTGTTGHRNRFFVSVENEGISLGPTPNDLKDKGGESTGGHACERPRNGSRALDR